MSGWDILDDAEFKCIKIFSSQGEELVNACIVGVHAVDRIYKRTKNIDKALEGGNIRCNLEFRDIGKFNACRTGVSIMYDYIK